MYFPKFRVTPSEQIFGGLTSILWTTYKSGNLAAAHWNNWVLNPSRDGFFKTPRIKQAEQLALATQEKYGMAPIYASHSLGGYLAEQAAKKTPDSQVYTYNKAAGLPSAFYERPKNQTDYRTALDIPSALSAFQSGGTSKTLMGNLFSPIASHDIKYLK